MANEILKNREFELVLAATSKSNKWALRNRLLLLMTHCTGARVTELAAMRLADVVAVNGEILAEVICRTRTKRTLVMTQQIRKELASF